MKKVLAVIFAVLAFLVILPGAIQWMGSIPTGANAVANAIQGVTISVAIYSNVIAVLGAILSSVLAGLVFYYLVK